jgi:dipeptidyl aminopeptidase/acylaminoacyl peptidase
MVLLQVVDAEDVLSVVQALVEQGIAHPSQVVIQGGSAGGFTVLNALVTGSVFAAGASYYGVADMLSLASDTHDFESRYLDSLLGPLPQSRDTYIARSPLTHVSKMSAALILFQGSEDKVPPLRSCSACFDSVFRLCHRPRAKSSAMLAKPKASSAST